LATELDHIENEVIERGSEEVTENDPGELVKDISLEEELSIKEKEKG